MYFKPGSDLTICALTPVSDPDFPAHDPELTLDEIVLTAKNGTEPTFDNF